MDNSRLLDCLDDDYRRLRDVVPGHLDAPVPSCPQWTVADLTRHVAQVYLHKVEMMRHGKEPGTWPPDGFAEADPLGLLDQHYAELTAQFAARDPDEACLTWYGPDQTVGFWVRRMAQETLIHRIDAELAVGATVRPAPDDLAVDGIDELMTMFVSYSFSQWPEAFAEVLAGSPGHTVRLAADARTPIASWLVRTGPAHLSVAGGPGKAPAGPVRPDVTVSGPPTAILRWAWNRDAPELAPGPAGSVLIDGDASAVAEFRRCVVVATQLRLAPGGRPEEVAGAAQPGG